MGTPSSGQSDATHHHDTFSNETSDGPSNIEPALAALDISPAKPSSPQVSVGGMLIHSTPQSELPRKDPSPMEAFGNNLFLQASPASLPFLNGEVKNVEDVPDDAMAIDLPTPPDVYPTTGEEQPIHESIMPVDPTPLSPKATTRKKRTLSGTSEDDVEVEDLIQSMDFSEDSGKNVRSKGKGVSFSITSRLQTSVFIYYIRSIHGNGVMDMSQTVLTQ